MSTTLLTLPLRRKRDLFLARQRARQVAGLLGFDRRQQATLAAAVFDMADRARRQSRSALLHFRTVERRLVIDLGLGCAWQLEQLLPPKAQTMSAADWTWAIREVSERTPLDIFEEMRLQNQELLQALAELESVRRTSTRSAA